MVAGCDNKQGSGISRTLRYTASLRSAATPDADCSTKEVLLQVFNVLGDQPPGGRPLA
jgi:hypothetical protein